VINGVVSVPIMIAMMLVVASGKHTGPLAIPAWLRALGWASAALMALTVAALIWSSV
jgi:Mn2+/Fe2+ NRAMP family transporter